MKNPAILLWPTWRVHNVNQIIIKFIIEFLKSFFFLLLISRVYLVVSFLLLWIWQHHKVLQQCNNIIRSQSDDWLWQETYFLETKCFSLFGLHVDKINVWSKIFYFKPFIFCSKRKWFFLLSTLSHKMFGLVCGQPYLLT